MSGLTFLHPWLLGLGVLVIIAWWWRRRRGQDVVHFAPAMLLPDAVSTAGRSRWVAAVNLLRLVGLLLVTVALARPQGRERLPLESEGIDILLCLDVSSSMASTDMDRTRTRLAVAKDAARRFVAGRPSDRVGLIAFARYPDVICPLTLRHNSLSRFLAEVPMVEPDGPEDMTGIGTAITRAAQILVNSVAKSKVVILLTDGRENVATPDTPEEIDPIEAAFLCKELGIRVYSIAAGADASQAATPGPARAPPVAQLATITGGQFFLSRDADAMASVYAEINALEKVPFKEPRFRAVERFLPCLVAALITLLLGRALEATILSISP